MRSNPGLVVEATSSWPSPAQDYYDGPVSLDEALLANPAATMVVRVRGDGLRSAGIVDGDELVVDRSLPLHPGRVVVVVVDGAHRVGRLVRAGRRYGLATDAGTVPLPAGTTGWGVATYAIHHLTGPA